MKKQPSQKVLATLGFLVIAALVAAVVFLITYLVDTLQSIDTEVAAAIVAASATFLAAVVTVVYSQTRSKAREISATHRSNKAEAYKGFMRFISDLLLESKNSDSSIQRGSLPKKLQETYFSIRSDLIVWGSPNVINAYKRLQYNLGTGSPATLLLCDDVLQEMRKDLGLSNAGFKRGDLIKMFLTNPEELDTFMKNM
jgi:hypothetical protein